MLEVRNLRKTYGSVVAVDDVSFSVGRGELVAVLGPNGAGKTTTVSIITGLIAPDRGEVLIGGARARGDADPLKRRIGLVPQDIALYDELSARDNLRFFGALFGMGVPFNTIEQQLGRSRGGYGRFSRYWPGSVSRNGHATASARSAAG